MLQNRILKGLALLRGESQASVVTIRLHRVLRSANVQVSMLLVPVLRLGSTPEGVLAGCSAFHRNCSLESRCYVLGNIRHGLQVLGSFCCSIAQCCRH